MKKLFCPNFSERKDTEVNKRREILIVRGLKEDKLSCLIVCSFNCNENEKVIFVQRDIRSLYAGSIL